MVVVSLVVVSEYVTVEIGYVHPDILALGHDAQTTRAVLSRVRSLLNGVYAAREAQRIVDAQVRHHRGACGASVLSFPSRCLLPVSLLDADTLFLGCLAGQAWIPSDLLPSDDRGPCRRCDGGAWGLTCCPPRWGRAGGVRRDYLDTLTAFCWVCLDRRDLTHMAPQNCV